MVGSFCLKERIELTLNYFFFMINYVKIKSKVVSLTTHDIDFYDFFCEIHFILCLTFFFFTDSSTTRQHSGGEFPLFGFRSVS